MPDLEWLDYAGQTTAELLALEGAYRIDSLVVAFETAIQQKLYREDAPEGSNEECIVLAVEVLEREVNNGGFDQFFRNSSFDIFRSPPEPGLPPVRQVALQGNNPAFWPRGPKLKNRPFIFQLDREKTLARAATLPET